MDKAIKYFFKGPKIADLEEHQLSVFGTEKHVRINAEVDADYDLGKKKLAPIIF